MPLKNITKFCTAKSKRTGLPCKNPPIGACKTCRFHGGWKQNSRETPKGEAHWNYKDGSLTKESIAERQKTLLRLHMLEEIGHHIKLFHEDAPKRRGRKPTGWEHLDLNDRSQMALAILKTIKV